MAKKTPKSAILGLLQQAAANEQLAVEFLERYRWGSSPACPLCESPDVYQMAGADGGRNKDYRWRCRGCRKMYSVRTGTVMQESRLALRIWVHAFWRACASKKGCSALQLSREMQITHKSALFVLRRLRFGLGDGPDRPKLSGTVEADETFVGGRPRHKHTSKRGRGTKKTPVLGIVERGGKVRFHVMGRITEKTLAKAIHESVEATSRLMTDELSLYRMAGEAFEGGHETVKHSAGEYKRAGTDVHSNTIEGVFSLLKRGVMGTYHSISRKHLANYLDEFAFRHNTRKVNDDERIVRAIRQVVGKRLEYRESVEAPPWAVASA